MNGKKVSITNTPITNFVTAFYETIHIARKENEISQNGDIMEMEEKKRISADILELEEENRNSFKSMIFGRLSFKRSRKLRLSFKKSRNSSMNNIE